LEAQPGIIVGRTGARGGKFFVTGSRDPNAANPETILKEQTALDPNDVISSWQSHLSLEPEIVLARARSQLEPPSGVVLKFDQGKLSAEGATSHQWIAEAQRLAPLIPGVAEFDDTNLIDKDLDELRLQIERQVIRFVVGRDQIAAGQNQAIKDLAAQIKTLSAQAPAAGRVARIEIVGHTDTEGDENTNQRLSDSRAARILSMLTVSGVNKDIFFIRGAASKEPVRPETSASDREFNRSVSFKITLLNPHKSAPQHPQRN
jgi:OOP family OmpA-OmpF porin